MKITGENIIPVDQETVWRGLNDPEVLRQSIPGCESLEQTAPNVMTAVVVTRIGPVSARFEGQVELSDLDPPRGYKLNGSGSAGPMGNAKGAAVVTLASMPDGGTKLTYDVTAEMTGKIAQLGARLIQSTAGILAGQFFSRFGAIVSGGKPSDANRGVGRYVLIGALVIAAGVAAYFLLA